jgi:hypothetical protein
MNGDRERGFQMGPLGESERMDAFLAEIQAVVARHGFAGMAIEGIELYPLEASEVSGVASGVQGYVRAITPRMPDIPGRAFGTDPFGADVGAFIKAGPARRCPDGKPAVFRCFRTPDGKVQCRWVCP